MTVTLNTDTGRTQPVSGGLGLCLSFVTVCLLLCGCGHRRIHSPTVLLAGDAGFQAVCSRTHRMRASEAPAPPAAPPPRAQPISQTTPIQLPTRAAAALGPWPGSSVVGDLCAAGLP
jgi:hypothetical protein